MFPHDSDEDPCFQLAMKRVEEGVAAGVLENLPGAGKPLYIEEPPPFVSREDWLTMKVLRDSGVLPPEVELMKEAALLREELKKELAEEEREEKVRQLRAMELQAQILLDDRARRLRR